MKKIIIFTLILCFALLSACAKDKEAQKPDGGTAQGSGVSAGNDQTAPDTPSDKIGAISPEASEGANDALPTVPQGPVPLTYGDYSFNGTFKDEAVCDEVLVNMSILLPKVDGNADIQLYYEGVVDRMKELAQTFYLDLGRGNYQFAANGIGIFTPVTAEIGYRVTLNDGKLFSVRREIYENTGGAHPSVVLDSETFRVFDGALMLFDDLFTVSREEALAKLRPMIEKQMDAKVKEYGEEYYFQNAKADLFNMWDDGDFYFTETGLVIYWQTYAISPYVAGIQEFEIPLEDIKDILKTEF